MTSCLTTEAVETMEWSQTTEAVEVIDADYVVDVMQIITALRKKHHPQVDCRASHMSTVGLVVEGGSHISAVVPGGTCAQTHFVCPIYVHTSPHPQAHQALPHTRANAHAQGRAIVISAGSASVRATKSCW